MEDAKITSPALREAQEERRQLLEQRDALRKRLELQQSVAQSSEAAPMLELPTRYELSVATAPNWHSRHNAGGDLNPFAPSPAAPPSDDAPPPSAAA
eukprot:3883158-Prymnesium_polylepis.1